MQNTGEDVSSEDWSELLGALTLEELQQYGQIAIDQSVLAGRWFGLQVVVLILTAGFAAWGVWSDLRTGLRMETFYWIAPALMVIYWLYRSAKARRLWWGHVGEVDSELVRRGEGKMTTGSELI